MAGPFGKKSISIRPVGTRRTSGRQAVRLCADRRMVNNFGEMNFDIASGHAKARITCE